MARVKVRDPPVQIRLPCVNDFAESEIIAGVVVKPEFSAALRIRAKVDRLRKRITEVHQQPMAGWMPKGKLPGVVVAHTAAR